MNIVQCTDKRVIVLDKQIKKLTSIAIYDYNLLSYLSIAIKIAKNKIIKFINSDFVDIKTAIRMYNTLPIEFFNSLDEKENQIS